MLHIEGWKRVVIWATCALGLLFALPNGFYGQVESYNDAQEAGQEATGWPSFLPSGLVNLGLDLRGGAHLLGEVKLEEVYTTRLEGFWPEVRNALRDERATIGAIRQQEGGAGELVVRIGNPEQMDRAIEVVQTLARPVASLTGGMTDDIVVSALGNNLIVTLSEAEQLATDDRTMAQSLEIIRRRVDEAGTREPTIQRQGKDRILIQVPGLGSAQELKDLIGVPALLTFQTVVGRSSNPNGAAGVGNELLPAADNPDLYYILERTPVVTGEELTDAQPSFDRNSGRPAVNFRFNTSGARKFGQYTTDHVGDPFAIVLDDEVISAPVIEVPITGGSGIITGNFDVAESTRLATLLRAGSLPASLEFLEERTVGPELGQDSIDAGKIACLVGFAAVLIFMFLSYGTFGIFANIALLINVGLMFGLLSMIGATLTLPGIAGIVLTIGMAVDANVLVFERIREELKTAKGPARAIELGYEKALSAIVDANITTFLTAAILFIMGAGPVKGFAVTLGLGIITSVFTAIFVTRAMVVIWFERRKPKTLEV